MIECLLLAYCVRIPGEVHVIFRTIDYRLHIRLNKGIVRSELKYALIIIAHKSGYMLPVKNE
jgi:hypothetical protein